MNVPADRFGTGRLEFHERLGVVPRPGSTDLAVRTRSWEMAACRLFHIDEAELDNLFE